MVEYVERDKVLALQTNLHFDNIEQLKHWKCRHIDPIEVQLLPAADVAPVVRGKWKTAMLDHEAFGERPRVSYCSVCNQIVTFRTFFCPNCGADMREEKENAEI